MKRRGRPNLPKPERKAKVLCTRVDLESYRTFIRAADASKMKFTDWVRARLIEAARRELTA